MAKKKYVSKIRGNFVALDEKGTEKLKELAEKLKELRGKSLLHFPSRNPEIVTDSVELQKLIESTDSFKKGDIERVKTPEELAGLARAKRKSDFKETASKLGLKVTDAQLEKALSKEERN